MIALHGFREHPAPMSAADAHLPGATVAVVSDMATVHVSASIGEGAQVHPRVVIERGASVGRHSIIYPGVYVGADARIGDNCILHPNVVVYDRCVVGDRVTLHAGCVIGSDGFGYATHRGAHWGLRFPDTSGPARQERRHLLKPSSIRPQSFWRANSRARPDHGNDRSRSDQRQIG